MAAASSSVSGRMARESSFIGGKSGTAGAMLKATRLPRVLLAIQECRHLWTAPEPCQFCRRRQLRFVAPCVHHAEKTERLGARSTELVPCHWRHSNEVVELDRFHLLPDKTAAMPAQDKHGMHVLVPLERGKAAGSQLEITQLRLHVPVREEH